MAERGAGFLARRVLQGMVVSFPKDATQTRGADKLTRRAASMASRRQRCSAYQGNKPLMARCALLRNAMKALNPSI